MFQKAAALVRRRIGEFKPPGPVTGAAATAKGRRATLGTLGVGSAWIATLLVAGCSTPRSYLTPSPPEIGYADLYRPEKPLRLVLTTAFQRNGQPYPAVDPDLRVRVETTLRRTGIIEPVTADSEGDISVVVNNVSAEDALARRGTPLGQFGTAMADQYTMTVTIRTGLAGTTAAGQRPTYFMSSSTAEAPTGLDLMSSDRSFGQVVEQMLLKILRDFQDRNRGSAGISLPAGRT